MRRLVWALGAFVLLAAALVAATPAASPNFPARIDFPAGWFAEGIATGKGHTFYAGNTANGAIYVGDYRTGTGEVLVEGVTGRSAFGVFADNRDRLFVAGGRTCHAYVYDADTGALLADYTLTTGTCFINDVTVTKDGAYFTNTAGATVIFKIPIAPNGELGSTVETIPVPFVGGNGIEATPNGKTLIAVSITTGLLYAIDTETLAVTLIPITVPAGMDPPARGDGLILIGHTLYYIENLPSAALPGRTGGVAVIELSPDYSSGTLVDRLNSPDDPLINPATGDRFGNRIYVVRRNAPAPAPPAFHLTLLPAH